MNKLVHNLSLDAGFSKRDDGLIYSPYKEEYDITEELHDFAKLIVLECAKVITTAGHWSGGERFGRWETAEIIKSHFNLNVNNDD